MIRDLGLEEIACIVASLRAAADEVLDETASDAYLALAAQISSSDRLILVPMRSPWTIPPAPLDPPQKPEGIE